MSGSDPGTDRVGFVGSVQPTNHDLDAVRAFTNLPGAMPSTNSATALLPGLIHGIPAYTVKVNAKFPASTPALRGVVCLHDLSSGELLALLDSASLTARRTGLSAALVTDQLAPAEARTVALIGAGAQAAIVLAGLSHLRRVDRIIVHDTDPEKSERFCHDHTANGLVCELAPTASAAAREAEIIVTATWARQPILDWPDIYPGHHITVLGADEPGKQEVTPEILRRSWLVVDDRRLAITSGAVGSAGLDPRAIDASAAEVIARATPPFPRTHHVRTRWTSLARPRPRLADLSTFAGDSGRCDGRLPGLAAIDLIERARLT